MIISASRRTDIPAFYGEWFINRLREGFVYVRNPYNHKQVSKIALCPEVVDCIVFWTKNPQPFFPYLQELDDLGFTYYFQYTLTPYDKTIEKNLLRKEDLVASFIKLADFVGSSRVIWRYDPILLTAKINLNYHYEHFTDLARKLSGSTNRCVISFIDFYTKTRRNTKKLNLNMITNEDMLILGNDLAAIGNDYGLQLFSCAESVDLSKMGVKKGKCIDDKLIESLIDSPLQVRKDKNQRETCGCVESIDIGVYNSCPHQCLYCYANENLTSIIANTKNHCSKSPFLIGKIQDNEQIKARKMRSLKDNQGRLF